MEHPRTAEPTPEPSPGDAEEHRRAELALLSVASHDLRGALANVRSYASYLLARGPVSPEKLARSAEVIVRNADRALQLAQEYFDSRRCELGGLPMEVEPLDPGPIFREALEGCAALAADRNAQLIVDVPARLPVLSADAGRLAHALSAFVAQGLWRTEVGGVVLVDVSCPDSVVRVSVHDTGPELSGEWLTSWFDARFRARKERKLEPGFRLCLAKREIEALGGRAGVSTGTDATTHWFELPALQSHS